jgi:signal transduction histidine kinase
VTTTARTLDDDDGRAAGRDLDLDAPPTTRRTRWLRTLPRSTSWLRRVPFRLRLTLSFAVVIVVLFGGLALLLQTQFAASLDESINRSLHTHAVDVASIVSGDRELPQLPESGGAFAQIIDPADGRVLDFTPGHSRPLLSAADARRMSSHPVLTRGALVDRGHARLLVGRIGTVPPSVLVVGSSLAQRNRALTTLTELLFIGGPLMLVLTCVAGYVLAERALAPVETMSARAARISGAPRGERLPVPEANDELRRLGETLNEMLSRLEDALARERQLVADAGHELRTPLSILKLELELALASDSSRKELRARVASAAEEVDRLAGLAQDLLVIARAELGRLPLEKRRVEVGDVLGAVADRFAAPSAGSGRRVRLEDSNGLWIDADPTRLEQALTNLVSNALRHGDGPVVLRAGLVGGGAGLVSGGAGRMDGGVGRIGSTAARMDGGVGRVGGTVELHVLDEGGGFEPEFLPRAFERFSRADPARSGSGAGLGLSIVQVIAEAHGGEAYAANRPSGGADVWLALPAG